MKSGNVLPKEDEEKRMKLYEAGLKDTEIAEQCFVTSSAIYNWRKSRNLKAKNKRGSSKRKEFSPIFKELYEKGYNDRMIADHVCCSIPCVRHWRIDNNLPVNKKREYKWIKK